MKKIPVLLSFLIGIATTTGSSAQPEQGPGTPTTLPEILVEGASITRGFEETLHEQPATIHSISGEDIEKMDSRTTLDLIRRIPGVTAENYNQQGVAAAYSFRGFRLGHGIGAASYLDGIPYNEINNPEGDGYPDYNTVLPESIERLEVIKGLASPRFGAYAQAGVLHFITKERGDYSKLKLSTGSWGYHRGVMEIARNKDRFFTYNAISTEQGNGYRNHSEFSGGNIFSRFGYDLGHDDTVRLTLHSYKTAWNAPGPLPQADWDSGNLKRQITDGGGNKKKNMVSVDYTKVLTASSEISLLAYGYGSDYTRWTAANNVERHDERNTAGARASYFTSNTLAGLVNELLLGIDYENADSQARSWNVLHPLTRERANLNLSGDFSFRSMAFYFQDDIRPSSSVKLSLGGRYEIFDGELDNNLTGVSSSYSEQIFNPKGGVLITPRDGLELYGNIGTGFVLPSGFLKFENSRVDPSKLRSYDLGTRYQPLPEALLQLSLYRTDTEDEVIVDPITLTETNAGETRRQGVEASAEWYLYRDILVYLSGASQDAKYVAYNTRNGNFTGKKISRVPELIANAGLEYFPERGWGGALNASYTGARWNNNANTIREQAYLIANASIRYAIPEATFTLFLNNLLDKKYSELRGAADYYPADPFNITFTVALNL